MTEALDQPPVETHETLHVESDFEVSEGERLSPAGVLGDAMSTIQSRWSSWQTQRERLITQAQGQPSVIEKVASVADRFSADMRKAWEGLRGEIESRGEDIYPIKNPGSRKRWAEFYKGFAGFSGPLDECLTAAEADRIFGPATEVPTGRLSGIPEMTDISLLAEIPEDAHRIRADRYWEEHEDGNKLRKIEYKPAEGDYPILIVDLDDNGKPIGFRMRTVRVIEGIEVPVEEAFDRDHVPVDLAQMMGWTLEMS